MIVVSLIIVPLIILSLIIVSMVPLARHSQGAGQIGAYGDRSAGCNVRGKVGGEADLITVRIRLEREPPVSVGTVNRIDVIADDDTKLSD
jgi:hypothetical protein